MDAAVRAAGPGHGQPPQGRLSAPPKTFRSFRNEYPYQARRCRHAAPRSRRLGVCLRHHHVRGHPAVRRRLDRHRQGAARVLRGDGRYRFPLRHQQRDRPDRRVHRHADQCEVHRRCVHGQHGQHRRGRRSGQAHRLHQGRQRRLDQRHPGRRTAVCRRPDAELPRPGGPHHCGWHAQLRYLGEGCRTGSDLSVQRSRLRRGLLGPGDPDPGKHGICRRRSEHLRPRHLLHGPGSDTAVDHRHRVRSGGVSRPVSRVAEVSGLAAGRSDCRHPLADERSAERHLHGQGAGVDQRRRHRWHGLLADQHSVRHQRRCGARVQWRRPRYGCVEQDLPVPA